MKNQITILFLFVVCFAVLSMYVVETPVAETLETLKLDMHAGYRVDQLDWNIAGLNSSGQYVNVLSELDWEDLEIWQLGVAGKLAFANTKGPIRIYTRASIDYGWITGGTTRDSDYQGNNRTQESYRSFNDTEDDNVFDTSIGIGFEKDLWQNRLTLGLLGGYSYHEQNLRLTNLLVVIVNGAILQPSRPFPGLNSTYETQWRGPFIGLDFKLDPFPRISLSGSVEYHWSDYEAEADWNLREEWAHPLSFRHDTDEADGLVVSLKGSYLISAGWLLDLTYLYRDFSAGDGLYRLFPAVGTPVDSKFNEANWRSSAITLGVTYKFK